MTTKKVSLRLVVHEEALLKHLYAERRIATDEYMRRPADLEDLVTTFNNLTGRKDSPTDLLHYMVTRRKKSQWVRLGEECLRNSSSQVIELTSDDFIVLDEIYEDLQVGSDKLVFDEEVRDKFTKEFARRTKKIVPALILAATMVRRRKGGSLATLRPDNTATPAIGFQDIDEIAS